MRIFKLINGNGEEFDLMRKDAFFHSIGGLGFGETADFHRAGSAFIPLQKEEKQPAPNGTISFAGYSQYQELKQFCRVDGLVLAYKQLETWYYLDCIAELEHSDINRSTKMLDCSVQFTGKSQWYEKITEYRTESDTSGGKVYPYTYPYTYVSAHPGVVEIDNGQREGICRIHILGPCENPSFTLSQGDTRIADGKVLCSILSGRKLVIDSDPANMEIAEYTVQNEYVADRYGDSDFETDRIVTLPKGKSRFAFTHDGTDFINAWVEVKRLV